jgi:predicted acylesterase/phospholipase RssA
MTWRDLADLARGVFWPSLLHGATLERFCARHLPSDFSGLQIPFAAVATTLPDKRAVAIRTGSLASAISASCAMRVIRRRVRREDKILKDGGIARALPADFCRRLGAEFVIGSDVWELSSLLRGIGVHPAHPQARRLYPHQYHVSLHHTDLLINPQVPLAGYWPGEDGIRRMIDAGYRAACQAFERSPRRSGPESHRS